MNYLLPFFSSWLSTEPASFLASAVVGFFAPDRILEARVEVLLLDCFLAIGASLFQWSAA